MYDAIFHQVDQITADKYETSKADLALFSQDETPISDEDFYATISKVAQNLAVILFACGTVETKPIHMLDSAVNMEVDIQSRLVIHKIIVDCELFLILDSDFLILHRREFSLKLLDYLRIPLVSEDKIDPHELFSISLNHNLYNIIYPIEDSLYEKSQMINKVKEICNFIIKNIPDTESKIFDF